MDGSGFVSRGPKCHNPLILGAIHPPLLLQAIYQQCSALCSAKALQGVREGQDNQPARKQQEKSPHRSAVRKERAADTCLQKPHKTLLSCGGKKNITGKDVPTQSWGRTDACAGTVLSQLVDLYNCQTPSFLVLSLGEQMQHH